MKGAMPAERFFAFNADADAYDYASGANGTSSDMTSNACHVRRGV
jgi:hypothetical protein